MPAKIAGGDQFAAPAHQLVDLRLMSGIARYRRDPWDGVRCHHIDVEFIMAPDGERLDRKSDLRYFVTCLLNEPQKP
ncbi:hypothetical protein A7R75_30500 [Mycolicibacterium llatzerense]|nr:hypothetical protein [Mycolicibacterium llatzerense]